MHLRRLLLAALLASSIHSAFAQERPAIIPFAKLRGAMAQKVVRGKVRVFYETTGPHAVSKEDANRNGIPDQPEDVLTQASASWQLWTSLGYPDPLLAPRYAGVAWIDVHLLNKAVVTSNGVAYDELQRFARPGDPPGTTSLCFDVATTVNATTNLTPAHEMFHIIQNGATFFKNRWLTEGTARWSERGLGTGALTSGLKATNWPPGDAGQDTVFKGAYETALSYWEPLLTRMDTVAKIPQASLPPGLINAHYSNGETVLKDLDLCGAAFIAEVLKSLHAADDIVFRERKLDRWSEAEQRSTENNATIHRCVMEVAQKHGLKL